MKVKALMRSLLFCTLSGMAPRALAEAAASGGELLPQDASLMETLARGGFVMVVLGLMSVAGLALVIYLFYSLRRSQVVPTQLRDDVLDKLEGGNLADARTACGYRPCAFSEVVVAAVDVGILNLTNYKPPAPDDYYLGQRRLTAELRDLYGQLIDGIP